MRKSWWVGEEGLRRLRTTEDIKGMNGPGEIGIVDRPFFAFPKGIQILEFFNLLLFFLMTDAFDVCNVFSEQGENLGVISKCG